MANLKDRKIFKNTFERLLFLILTGAETPFNFLFIPILMAFFNCIFTFFDFKYFSIICFLFYEYLIANRLFYFTVDGLIYFTIMFLVNFFIK